MGQPRPAVWNFMTGEDGTLVDIKPSDTGREGRVDITWIPTMAFTKRIEHNISEMDVVRKSRPGMVKGNPELVIILKRPDAESSFVLEAIDKHYDNLSGKITSIRQKSNRAISRADYKERWREKKRESKDDDKKKDDNSPFSEATRRRSKLAR